MEYHNITPRKLPPIPGHPCDRHSISEGTGLSVLSLNTYILEPGDNLAAEYHYHEQREEALIVENGPLFIETPEKTYRVESNHVFVVEPKSPIRPYNPTSADSTIEIIGVGAPAYDIGHPYDPDKPTDFE